MIENFEGRPNRLYDETNLFGKSNSTASRFDNKSIFDSETVPVLKKYGEKHRVDVSILATEGEPYTTEPRSAEVKPHTDIVPKDSVFLRITADKKDLTGFWKDVGAERADRKREQEQRREAKLNEASTSREAYMALLDVSDYPQLPADLPEKIRLPAEIAVPLKLGIIDTLGDQKENSQLVWRTDKKNFKFGKVFEGNTKHIGYIPALHNSIRQSRLVRNNPLIAFHTHPDDGEPFFSSQDIAAVGAMHSPSEMRVVGSREGMYALCLTEQFRERHAKLKIGIKGAEELRGELANSNFTSEGPYKAAKILEDMGIGVFAWYHGKNGLWTPQPENKPIELRRV